MNPSLWVDLASPSHPFFFNSLINDLDTKYRFEVTVRDKTENIDICADLGLEARTIGRDYSKPILRKFGLPLRGVQLALQGPSSDIALFSRDVACLFACKLKRIPSVHYTDNDITAHRDGLTYDKLYNRLMATSSHIVVPSAFETAEFTDRGTPASRIHTYDGYKEDVYVADFEADETFTDLLPFEEYIVIRPEALGASYVNAEKSIVPKLTDLAINRGYNIVYLPRGRGDDEYVDQSHEQVHVPDTAVNGLQLIWHSDCVLTGSGTMAREGASMAKPAVSFFPNTPLSVDQELIKKEAIFRSRNPSEIVDYIDGLSNQEISADLTRSKRVKEEVIDLTEQIVELEVRDGD